MTIQPNTLPVLRDTLRFAVPVTLVRRGLSAKVQYHDQRVSHWLGEVDAREAKLRAEGVSVTTQVQAKSSSSYLNEVNVDQGMVGRVREAQAKLTEHRDRLRVYREWEATLRHPLHDPELLLTHNDCVFFGLSLLDE